MKKKISSLVLEKTIPFGIFIIGLLIMNLFMKNMPSPIPLIVSFFNANIYLFLILFFLGILTDLFWNIKFPLNIFAPISSSVLSIFIIAFFYNLWNFVDSFINSGITIPINLIYIIVFLITLISGYVRIFAQKTVKGKDVKKSKGKKYKLKWEDVGEEFKLVFYNIAHGLNKLFSSKKKVRK